jgi:hypothetical protein
MLSDIVSGLLREEPNLRVAVATGAPAEWVAASEVSAADVVVTIVEHGQAPTGAAALLLQRPDLKLLALEGDTSEAFLFKLTPQKAALGKLSPEGLIAAIRSAASESREFEDVPALEDFAK